MKYIRLDAVLEIIDKKVHNWRVKAQSVQGTHREEDAHDYTYVADELANVSAYIRYKTYGPPEVADGEFQPYWLESPRFEAINLDMREME